MTQWYLDECGQWVYMFDIIDVYTREIVGYSANLRCQTKEALAALILIFVSFHLHIIEKESFSICWIMLSWSHRFSL